MDYTVEAVREALGVLMIVAHNPRLGVTEIGKRSGNTKARTFRFLVTLEEAAFVQRDKDATTYSLGHMALVLGLAAQEQVSIVKLADKYLDALQDKFNENAVLMVRDALEYVSVATRLSTHEVRVGAALGRRRPLHAGASGKVLLAFAPAQVQESVLNGELEKFTSHTITSKTRLRQELKKIAEQGYATSVSEMAADVIAVSAPVHDSTGSVQAAIGISLPANRAPADLGKLCQAVRKSAADLSAELGWKK
ncbi:MAG: IclR family transcriptional regulator [Burkholderiales bacterium]|nr:IclR family transcriptional regulator [Burkholderiales bacterium]